MVRQTISDAQVLAALDHFAATHMVPGGSLRVREYNNWRGRSVSFSTISKRFGDGSWDATIIRLREHLVLHAASPDVVVEVPVECHGNGAAWVWLRAGDWLSYRCTCDHCKAPTIEAAYPHLVSLLADPRGARFATTRRVDWQCPESRRHWLVKATAEHVAKTSTWCFGCQKLDAWYLTHTPGTLLTRAKVQRSKAEAPFVAELRALLPEERIATLQAVVVPREFAARIGKAITPDAMLFRRKIAIELDGGDGGSGWYSEHDTAEGIRVDTARDHAFAALGWTVVRVRHPNALPLPESPARIVSTPAAVRSPAKAAALVAEHLATLLHGDETVQE